VQKIEDCIGHFIQGIEEAAECLRQKRLEHELWQKKYDDRKKKAEEKYNAEMLEKCKADKLCGDVEAWLRAKEIRAYIKELESLGDILRFKDWIEWSRDYAEYIDPLNKLDEIVFNSEKAIYPKYKDTAFNFYD